jgi:ATP-dependent helicase YprA (DUF1998 family)
MFASQRHASHFRTVRLPDQILRRHRAAARALLETGLAYDRHWLITTPTG